jgi:hypothetical protein
MLLVEFEPTLFTARYRDAITPSDARASFVQRRLIIERLEFERFFDRTR